MMRLSSNLRRYRWAVFAVRLLLLVPSIYLALNQSGNLTGGGTTVTIGTSGNDLVLSYAPG